MSTPAIRVARRRVSRAHSLSGAAGVPDYTYIAHGMIDGGPCFAEAAGGGCLLEGPSRRKTALHEI